MTASDQNPSDRLADSTPPRRRPRGGATLAWAVVEGAIVPVSQFAGIPPRRRPKAHCPECGRPVVFKLGPILAHHVQHAPDAVCAATQPETALHINAKHHAANELRRAAADGVATTLMRACLAGRVRSRGLLDRSSDVTWEEWEAPRA